MFLRETCIQKTFDSFFSYKRPKPAQKNELTITFVMSSLIYVDKMFIKQLFFRPTDIKICGILNPFSTV